MCMDSLFPVAAALFLILAAPCLAAQSPDLGQVATQDDIASWDISISPDGTGLPPGSGTAKQGEVIYTAQCASCHGEKGAGNPKEPPSNVSPGPLAGGQGTLGGIPATMRSWWSYWPYEETMFDYVRATMPWGAPKSLTDQKIYSLTAQILHLIRNVGEAERINAQTLA